MANIQAIITHKHFNNVNKLCFKKNKHSLVT
jgi:hypothetical protein